MAKGWQTLVQLSEQGEIIIERVHLPAQDIHVEGRFELPALAKLALDDQIFVAAFIKTHGSIKQMEQLFGVSYPTIKNRLNRLGKAFDFVKVDKEEGQLSILEQLERGELTVEEALERMSS